MPVNMAAGLSVNISIEQLLESEVEEISRDGQEKYVPQLSMSEQLTKLAHKIDFLSEDKNQTSTEDDEEKEDEKELVTFQPSLWPWDSVRTKLRNALTEVCVLSDILNVVHDKKYMLLDPVSQNQATPKPIVQHLAKRKNLSSAADIILKGAKRMETAVQERVDQQRRQGQQQEDFHSELIGLRQRWRLKKTGTSIMGDLTYRSAGSQFWNPGLFEVTKATRTDEEESQSPSTNDSSSLEVKVGSDLEGEASVTVSICESGITTPDNSKGKTRVLAKLQGVSNAPSWQQTLQSAQENIFCKELFTQLCQEAYNSRGPNVNLVMGQKIKTEVFPGVDLCITYTHDSKDDDTEETASGRTSMDAHNQPVAPTLNPLEYALHSLLRRRHKHNQSVVLPHPVTARQIPGTNKRLRIAGPAALRANEVKASLASDTILETIVKVSKHEILRKRVMEMIDKLTAEITEPCILCHWSSVSSETCTSAVVHIYSPEIQDMAKVSFRLQIGIKDISVICSSGTSVTFTSHLQDLKDFILTQIAQHRILIAYSIALSLGWQVLHINRHLPTGTTEGQGHVAGMVVTSSDADRTIGIRTGPSTGVTVSIKRPHKYTNTLPELLTDSKWSHVGGSFKDVAWDKMPGKTFVQKVFLLLGMDTKKS